MPVSVAMRFPHCEDCKNVDGEEMKEKKNLSQCGFRSARIVMLHRLSQDFDYYKSQSGFQFCEDYNLDGGSLGQDIFDVAMRGL